MPGGTKVAQATPRPAEHPGTVMQSVHGPTRRLLHGDRGPIPAAICALLKDVIEHSPPLTISGGAIVASSQGNQGSGSQGSGSQGSGSQGSGSQGSGSQGSGSVDEARTGAPLNEDSVRAGSGVEGSGGEGTQPGRAAQPSPAGAAPRVLSRRIVIVDDNEDIRETLRELLELVGHRVEVAADGPQGVALIRSSLPDLALVDIGLPTVTGYDVARQLCADVSTCPYLVAITGYGRPDDRRRALEAGFDDHLTKPVDPERLLTLINGLNLAPSE